MATVGESTRRFMRYAATLPLRKVVRREKVYNPFGLPTIWHQEELECGHVRIARTIRATRRCGQCGPEGGEDGNRN